MFGKVGARGSLQPRKVSAVRAPWWWRLSNACRGGYLRGWLAVHAVLPIARFFGLTVLHGELAVRVRRGVSCVWEDYGTVSYRVVTNAGVGFLVTDWFDNSTDVSNFNFHGCGTGTAAENASDTALGNEATTILDPDNTRATGTRSTPAANQFRSVGTLTFDGTGAITEHGLFSTSGTGTGTLWDRSVFAAINVAAGDSIQFTYTVTVSSGG